MSVVKLTDREDRVRKHLASMLSGLFDVEEEVEGKSILTGKVVRADLLLKPNEKAKAMGFEIDAVVIEIKDPKSKESIRKLLDGLVQAHSYTQSVFDGVIPSFALIYPPVQVFLNYDWVHKYNCDERERVDKHSRSLLLRMLQRLNVGELHLYDGKRKGEYSFSFPSGPFFDSIRGRSKTKGTGVNRYIGSQKTNATG